MGCSLDATGSDTVKSGNDFVGAQEIETVVAPGINSTSPDASEEHNIV